MKKSEIIKFKYETPVIVDLGASARGSGAANCASGSDFGWTRDCDGGQGVPNYYSCVSGWSADGGKCTQGNATTGGTHCTVGNGANANCFDGSSASGGVGSCDMTGTTPT